MVSPLAEETLTSPLRASVLRPLNKETSAPVLPPDAPPSTRILPPADSPDVPTPALIAVFPSKEMEPPAPDPWPAPAAKATLPASPVVADPLLTRTSPPETPAPLAATTDAPVSFIALPALTVTALPATAPCPPWRETLPEAPTLLSPVAKATLPDPPVADGPVARDTPPLCSCTEEVVPRVVRAVPSRDRAPPRSWMPVVAVKAILPEVTPTPDST